MRKIRFALWGVILSLFVLVMPVRAQYRNLTRSDSARQHTGNVEKISTPQKKTKKHNGGFFFGGGLGGGYSTYSSYIQVTPIIGYRVTPKFYIGSRLTYMHQWYKDYNNVKYNYNIFGGSLFFRYLFWKSLYAQAEYEILSVPDYYAADANTNRAVNSLFAGIGFLQPVGGNAFFTVSVLYNFLEDKYSPYGNPLVRIGFGF
jgi:hypothetical protein